MKAENRTTRLACNLHELDADFCDDFHVVLNITSFSHSYGQYFRSIYSGQPRQSRVDLIV